MRPASRVGRFFLSALVADPRRLRPYVTIGTGVSSSGAAYGIVGFRRKKTGVVFDKLSFCGIISVIRKVVG